MLNETIEEFKKRIKQNPNLAREFSIKPKIFLKGKNPFDVDVNLIKRLREAYINEDKESLDKIPIHLNEDFGGQAVSFAMKWEEDKRTIACYPFSNETVGEKIYSITNIFERLVNNGGTTKFYNYLIEKINEFKAERDSVKEDIFNSKVFKNFKNNLIPDINSAYGRYKKPDKEFLREAWRREEFKRKDKIIDLCDKAEHIYHLASRLYESLKDYCSKSICQISREFSD